jgi:hypothetical protein
LSTREIGSLTVRRRGINVEINVRKCLTIILELWYNSGMRIIRVFPRRTRATPTDELAFVGEPTLFAEADEVHISVSFTWDLPEAERLARSWSMVAPTKVGGPALGLPGGGFTPRMYVGDGYTITSRGCPNRCWFCSVWKREGGIRELDIQDGWNILDDNLLACSESHIREVFAMLRRQKNKPEFTGGLEAKLMKPWIAMELVSLKPTSAFFAYDTPDDLDPLAGCSKMIHDAGFSWKSHALRCYVLIGYPKDTMAEAEKRLITTAKLGYFPMAMLWRDKDGKRDSDWMKFQRVWARPHIVATKIRELGAGA